MSPTTNVTQDRRAPRCAWCNESGHALPDCPHALAAFGRRMLAAAALAAGEVAA